VSGYSDWLKREPTDDRHPEWFREGIRLGYVDSEPKPTNGAAGPPVPPDVPARPGEPPSLLSMDAGGEYRRRIRALDTIDRSPAPPLLLDRLDPFGHTILFGTGGVGKGTLAVWWAAELVKLGHRVLILDYENHPDEWARRYHGLAGADGADRVFHVAPLTIPGNPGPIWASPLEITSAWEDSEATFVIIDSIVTACGGADPTEPGTPARYAGALQRLPIPCLSLAHVTKADDLRYPFGSIFWHNLARVTWSMSKDGERVILANRKSNNYGIAGRSILEITWRDGLPVDILERSYSAALADQIDDVLVSGMTVSAIVRRLNEDAGEDAAPVKTDTVRHALRRGLRADPKRYAVTGTGDAATWMRA
jgi:hypothetical protein